jgi:response regulator of citrate/malate metabolism
MLVEDDQVDVMSIQRMFKKNQVTNPLYLARNGLEALLIIDELSQKNLIIKEILLILLDFYMPKMNGIEFLNCLQINSDFREIPIITFKTFHKTKTTIEKCHLNIIGELVKPVAFSAFTKILKFDPQTQQLSI